MGWRHREVTLHGEEDGENHDKLKPHVRCRLRTAGIPALEGVSTLAAGAWLAFGGGSGWRIGGGAGVSAVSGEFAQAWRVVMRDLRRFPVTVGEIERCLLEIAEGLPADQIGDMRPLLLRTAAKIVVRSGFVMESLKDLE
jgi:hypothetical protein